MMLNSYKSALKQCLQIPRAREFSTTVGYMFLSLTCRDWLQWVEGSDYRLILAYLVQPRATLNVQTSVQQTLLETLDVQIGLE